LLCNPHSCAGKEPADVGRTKSVIVNPCKSATSTFTRFVSNSIGDKYQDAGRFNQSLRSTSPILKEASISHASPFKTQGNRTVRKSEYGYNVDSAEPKGSPSLRPYVNREGTLYNRKTSEPFTSLNQIGYTEDPYERKQDFSREEYARLNAKILDKGNSF
jgi:hypothetical protein